MEIKKVHLIDHPAQLEPTDENGLGQPTNEQFFTFDVEVVGYDTILSVQNDPANADYWRVKEWYDNQQNKPFDFDFEEVGEPEFEETIYPPEPEEEEQSTESE